MKEKLVYADNAATTALSDVAFKEMYPYFQEFYGNASSIHSLGADAKDAIEKARRRIAKAINAVNSEIFFTSGGTESDNWALYGSLLMKNVKGKHIITSLIEHSAVYRTAKFLETIGYEVTYLPVDKYGRVSPSSLEDAIRDDTALVSIMMANNEIGTIQPIKELCKIAHKRRIPFHTDAVQAVGHIPVDVRNLGVDMLSMSAHKFRGPKGVGVLYVRLGRILPPMVIGGGQERGLRSGTENVPGIVGMAAALDEAVKNMDINIKKVTAMRDRIIESALCIGDVVLTGDPVDRLPGIASFLFPDLTNQAVISSLSKVGICASSGSACSSGSTELTRALDETLSISQDKSGSDNHRGALRISLNECNTDEDVDYIIHWLPIVIKELRTSKPPALISFFSDPKVLPDPDVQ